MKHKIYTTGLVAVIFLAFGLLTSCSSSSSTPPPPPPPPPTIAITSSSGSGQTQTLNEAFAKSLVANVTSNGTAASGVTVTFAAPSSGASCAPSATTATTDSSGNATITCTANGTAGSYSVTASASGATASASFSETNSAPSVFVFYVTGLETINSGPNIYAIAGAVGFDLSGNVVGGEQDYNNGFTVTSPTGGDTILTTGSSMTVDSTTGTGTLILATNNAAVGVAGTETFAVQFVNVDHALITQFDGTATSSGSMDLQSSSSASGNFAFTMSGVDLTYSPIGIGGVFTVSGGSLTGNADVNDNGVVTSATPGNLTATVNGTDGFGRGTTSSFTLGGAAFTLVYYVVGPEVVRIIDMDTTGVFVGSAYGQGSVTSFDSTALAATDVFGVQGNSWGFLYAATGNLVPAGAAVGTASATFTGEGDDDESGNVLASGTAIGGNYTFASNGYGFASAITGLGDITSLGLYAVDPALNLLDPNNTSGGGGVLVLDLDTGLSGGTGVIVPQAATTAQSDLNTSYGFGAQDFNSGTTTGWEFDFVGQGSFASGVLTGTGDVSDPFGWFVSGAALPYQGVAFAGTASGPDAAGRYTYSALEGIGPVGTNTTATSFTAVMYEANPALVFSIDDDGFSLWLGTYQQQSSTLKAAFMKGKKAAKAPVSKKH